MDSTASGNRVGGDGSSMDIDICTRCLFCGSNQVITPIKDVTDTFFHADDGTFDFLRCGSCGSLWLRNRPVGERLLKAYGNYHTHENDTTGSAGTSGLRGWIRASYFRSRFANSARPNDRLVAWAIALSGYDTSGLDKGLRFVPAPPAKILDYGCGSGKYLLRLRALDYELHGVEYDPYPLGKLAEAGIAVHDVAALDDDRWDQAFDHITLAHVLEHVPDPQALLLRLFRWLKPGGSLYVELPNADATGLAIFGRYWRGLEAPRHFSLPSRAALMEAFGRAGFGVDRQDIDRSARRWVWDESFQAAPIEARPALSAATVIAPPETKNNAEFLTFLARRPA